MHFKKFTDISRENRVLVLIDQAYIRILRTQCDSKTITSVLWDRKSDRSRMRESAPQKTFKLEFINFLPVQNTNPYEEDAIDGNECSDPGSSLFSLYYGLF